MTVFEIFFVFILGACFGSFANVLVVRMHKASSLWGRSRCPECRALLRPHHLVPILSWLALGGRCASCQKKIHFQYPIVEAVAGALAAIAFFRHPAFASPGEAALFLFEFIFTLDLLVLVVSDLRWRLLPIEFMAGSIVLFGAGSLLLGRASATSVFVGVAFGGLFLAAQTIISRGRWMGAGDPWLGALVGAVLGWPAVGLSFYLTYLAGGAVAVFLLVTRLAKRGARIPFAPLLALGAIVMLWFGEDILIVIARLLHL